MDLKSTYDRIAEDWNKDHLHDTWWIDGAQKFSSLLGPGSTILDVGCGSGIKAKYFIERGFRVAGIDLSEKMIEIAQREVPQGNFKVMDMYDISELTESFDNIFMVAALLHIKKEKAPNVLSAFASKLRPGGYFYVGVKEQRSGRKEEEIVKENDYGYDYERFFSYFTFDEIKKYFSDLAMKICYEDVSTTGKTNWVQVIGRSKG